MLDGILDGIMSFLGDTLTSVLEAILNATLFKVLYYAETALCWIISQLYDMFEVFAGIVRIQYGDEKPDYLINVFFSNPTVSNIYWAMALIGIALTFGFAIWAVVRKMFDIDGKQQQSLGQIIGAGLKSFFLIISMTLIISVVLRMTNTLMEQIDYTFNNAYHLNYSAEYVFSEEEYAAMGRVLATIGNASVVPNSKNRYNVNLCYNEIRGDNITPETDLSKLSPEDYPIFDDLYDQVLAEYQHVDNQFTRDMLRALMNYIAKFSTGGRNANIWNGPSTVTTDENFTVFNFQSMLANRNTTIANAQMLLVLKYIDNEVIKNRDYNTKYKAQRKVVVVIDEAHVFIDAKFPIALDFMFQLAKRIRKYNGMQIVITQNIKDFVGSEELARKSTAIINACQYSFIFALAPNDMQDLVKLYEKAGGINENEQEQIVQAARGQAFAIMGPTSRSTFQIETAQGITDMFQEREYQSQYFSGEQGAINWEDFVAGSREAHDKAILSRWDQEEDIEEMATVSRSSVVFEEVNEEELGAAPKKPGVVLFEEEDEDEEDADDAAKRHNILDEDDGTGSHEADNDAALRGAASLRTLDNQGADALAGLDPVAGGAAVGRIVSALGRVAEALERGGAIPAPAAASIQVPQPAAASAMTGVPAAETDAWESTASTEMETRLRELEERLAYMQDIQEQKDEMIRILREQNEQLRSAPPESAELEESSDSEPSFEIDWSSDEIQNTDFAWDEDAGAEIAWDEGEDAGAEIDRDTDEESGVFEEENDEDVDFMSALISYATAVSDMTVFERMRNDGETVLRITLDDLTKAINVKREKGNYF